jgi:hypothetical protein
LSGSGSEEKDYQSTCVSESRVCECYIMGGVSGQEHGYGHGHGHGHGHGKKS